MEDLESFWIFQESIDELKQKLQYTSVELELARKQKTEEIRKSNERIVKLYQLLQTTSKERDEAKAQLKKFQQIMAFNKKPNNNNNNNNNNYNSNNNNNNNFVNDLIIIPTTTTTAFPAAPFSPDSPLLTTNYPTKTNSSITESSSFSLETHTNTNNVNNNQQSHVSSPLVDSLSSPDSCNIVNFIAKPTTPPQPPPKIVDQESLIIANIARGRPLPIKGKLLQAVIEAGPLLSTLMVAGSLPQWRNPPGALTHQIPPVNLKGCIADGSGSGSSLGSDLNPSVGVMSHNKQIVMPTIGSTTTTTLYNGHITNSSGPLGMCQNSVLDFWNGSCFMSGRMMMNSGVGFDSQIPKRQRII